MKIEVISLANNKKIKVDKKLGEALVKMKYAKHIEKKQTYLTRSLQAEIPQIAEVESVNTDSLVLDNANLPKKRGRKKKELLIK